jgi:hypothetical protein
MKIGMMAAAGFLLLVGCGGGNGSDPAAEASACEQAWQTASEVPNTQDTHEDLHPAFSACTSFDEWRVASEQFPTVLDGVDPATYARNQCQYTQELAATPVCTSLP